MKKIFLCVLISLLVNHFACVKTPEESATSSKAAGVRVVADKAVEPAEVGIAVAILFDTSGSMNSTVTATGGGRDKKIDIARNALLSIIALLDEWHKTHAEKKLKVGLYRFSSSVHPLFDMADFDRTALSEKAARLTVPQGGTAIGEALAHAARELSKSGLTARHIFTLTDGENTVGVAPKAIAEKINATFKGEVKVHFVAFDTDPGKFGFVTKTGGTLSKADNEAELNMIMKEVFEKKILVEKEEL